MWRRLLGRGAGGSPAPSPQTTVAVLTTSRGWTADEIRVSPDGVSIEVAEANSWSAVCRLAHDQHGNWISPASGRTAAKLNGLPLLNAMLVSTGDVLEFKNGVFGLTFDSSVAKTTPVTEAEAFAGDLRAGLISVLETATGRHVQVRWRGGVDELARFAQSPLAQSAKTLDIIACRGKQPTVDAERVSALADCMVGLLPRCTFVVPAPLEVRASIATRVSEKVDLSLDGRLIDGESFWWLPASDDGGGLTPSITCTRAPYLHAIGRGRFLSCELGWGSLESIRLIDHNVEITETPDFQLALLAGDEWLITTKTGTKHHLRVTPSAAGPSLVSSPAERPAPLVFEGSALTNITFFHEDTDIVFARGEDGLFRGPSPGMIGAVGPDEFVWLTQSEAAFEFFDQTWVGSVRAIALPSPSPFLRGRTRFPPGSLTREKLIVFVDELLTSGDGAAIALRRLLDAVGSERDQWLKKLMVTRLRFRIDRWIATQREALSRFDEIQRVESRWASDVASAIETEPIFSFVRELRVEQASEDLCARIRASQWPRRTTVVAFRDGQEVARLEPSKRE